MNARMVTAPELAAGSTSAVDRDEEAGGAGCVVLPTLTSR